MSTMADSAGYFYAIVILMLSTQLKVKGVEITCDDDSPCAGDKVECDTDLNQEACTINCVDVDSCSGKILTCYGEFDCIINCGERACQGGVRMLVGESNNENSFFNLSCDGNRACFGDNEVTEVISNRRSEITCGTGGRSCAEMHVYISEPYPVKTINESVIHCDRAVCRNIKFVCNDPTRCRFDMADGTSNQDYVHTFDCRSAKCELSPARNWASTKSLRLGCDSSKDSTTQIIMDPSIIMCEGKVAGDPIELFDEIESETGTWEYSDLSPTTMPTTSPTASPTTMPTSAPSAGPSPSPTPDPSPAPSPEPTTPMPTQSPTVCTDTCTIDGTFYQGITVNDCVLLITEGNFEQDIDFNEASESFVDILNDAIEDRIQDLTEDGEFPMTVAVLEHFAIGDGELFDFNVDPVTDVELEAPLYAEDPLYEATIHDVNVHLFERILTFLTDDHVTGLFDSGSITDTDEAYISWNETSDDNLIFDFDLCYCSSIDDARDIYGDIANTDFGYSVGMTYSIFSDAYACIHRDEFDPIDEDGSFYFKLAARHILHSNFDFSNSGEFEFTVGSTDNLMAAQCLTDTSLWPLQVNLSSNYDFFQQRGVHEAAICGEIEFTNRYEVNFETALDALINDPSKTFEDCYSMGDVYEASLGDCFFEDRHAYANEKSPSNQPTARPTTPEPTARPTVCPSLSESGLCPLDCTEYEYEEGNPYQYYIENADGSQYCRCDTDIMDFCLAETCHQEGDTASGCNQCVGNGAYFKPDYIFPCVSCQETVGASCLFCADFDGCGQCANGARLEFDTGCNLYYCEDWCIEDGSSASSSESSSSDRRLISSTCDLTTLNIDELDGVSIGAGEQIVINCNDYASYLFYSGNVTATCSGNGTLFIDSDDCVYHECDLSSDPFGWGVNVTLTVFDVVRVDCSFVNPFTDWYDDGFAQYWCVSQDTVELFTTDTCIELGCTYDNTTFLSVGDKISVDCNDFDVTNNYNRGDVELECVSHETIEVISNTCVLQGCDFTFDPLGYGITAYYDIGESIEVDCNTYYSGSGIVYVGGKVYLQCTGEDVVEYISDTCVSEGQIFVEPNPSCDSTNSCDGSYDKPFPTIQEASDYVEYDYTKTITLKPGTYTGAGNTNLYFMSIERRFSSVSGSDVTIIDCENNGFGLALECGNYYFELSGVTIKNCNGYQEYNGGPTRGGGLWIVSTKSKFVDVKFVSNSADYGGGGYIYANDIEFDGVHFINNNANINGGGLYVESANVDIYGESVISGNTATNYGGGIYMYSNSLYINNSNVSSNTANIKGGAFYVQSASLFLNDRTIVFDNYALISGGGSFVLDGCIFLNGGSVMIDNDAASPDGTQDGNEIECVRSQVYAYDTSRIVTIRNDDDYDEADWLCEITCSAEQKRVDFDYCDPSSGSGTPEDDPPYITVCGELNWDSSSTFSQGSTLFSFCTPDDIESASINITEIETSFEGSVSVYTLEPSSSPLVVRVIGSQPPLDQVLTVTINLTSIDSAAIRQAREDVKNSTLYFETEKIYQIYAECPNGGSTLFMNFGGIYYEENDTITAYIPTLCFIQNQENNDFTNEYDLNMVVSLAKVGTNSGSNRRSRRSSRRNLLQVETDCDEFEAHPTITAVDIDISGCHDATSMTDDATFSSDDIAGCTINCCRLGDKATLDVGFSLVCPLQAGCDNYISEPFNNGLGSFFGIKFDHGQLGTEIHAMMSGYAAKFSPDVSEYDDFIVVYHAPEGFFSSSASGIDGRFWEYPFSIYTHMDLSSVTDDRIQDSWFDFDDTHYMNAGEILGEVDLNDNLPDSDDYPAFYLLAADKGNTLQGDVNPVEVEGLFALVNVEVCLNNMITINISDEGVDPDDSFLLVVNDDELEPPSPTGDSTQKYLAPFRLVEEVYTCGNDEFVWYNFIDININDPDFSLNGATIGLDVVSAPDDAGTYYIGIESTTADGIDDNWFLEDVLGNDVKFEEDKYFGRKEGTTVNFNGLFCRDT